MGMGQERREGRYGKEMETEWRTGERRVL